jgi:DNA-binding MarR family transcriptional regulator
MDAIDLIMLGRQLTRIGEETMRGSKEVPLPTGPTLVLRDVLTHPDSSISDVTARTALPQSYVSESVARLRDRGMVTTKVDPSDGRRTLVRMSSRHIRSVGEKGAVPVDAALAAALGETNSSKLDSVLRSLGDLAERLRRSEPGPFAQQLKSAKQGR